MLCHSGGGESDECGAREKLEDAWMWLVTCHVLGDVAVALRTMRLQCLSAAEHIVQDSEADDNRQHSIH